MTKPAASFITRPPTQIYGRHPGYGFAGLSVSTAIGNFTHTAVDLPFGSGMLGLLNWRRTYNSLSATAGGLGTGWTTSFSASLQPSESQGLLPHAAEEVNFHDEDGRVLVFTQAADGAFTSPQDLEATLARQADGGFTLAYNSGLVSTFDPSGRLTERSLEGQALTLGYDDAGHLVSVAHSSGASLGLSYDGAGRVTGVAASDGRTASYAYGPDGGLASVTVPGGGVTAFETTSGSGFLQVAKISDADGNLVVANSYDTSSGAVSGQGLPGSGTVTFGYGLTTGLTTVSTTPPEAIATFQADTNGRLTKAVNAAGNAATFGYNADGRLTQVVSPGGVQTAMDYDSRGNRTSFTFGGSTTVSTFDSSDRMLSNTNPVGSTTRYAYTGDTRIPSQIIGPGGGITSIAATGGLITSLTDPDGNTATFGHDASGNLTSLTSPRGETTSFSYDAFGNRTGAVFPDGSSASLGYDAAGRLTSIALPGGVQTSQEYSPGGLLLETTDPTGAITRYAYDAAGNQTTITDPLGQVTTFAYDAIGQLTAFANPAGAATRFGYDLLGNLTSMTDALGVETAYTYDPDGRQLTQQTPSGTITTGYDERGNVTSVTDAAGEVTRYEHDAASRLTAVTSPDGGVWSTAYDAVGNPVTRTDATGAVTRRQYTPAGNLQAVTDPLGRQTSYGRDLDGHVVSVTNPADGVTRYAYDPGGRLTSETTPAGLVTSYRYDAAGRLAATIDPRGWATRYEYTARGQRSAVIAPSGAVTRYRYDPADQLTEVINPNGGITQYGYDTAGHVIAATDPKDAASHFTYDADGRLTSFADPLGRATSYEYDKSGNLVTVTDPTGGVHRMAYDPDGRVTQRTGSDGATVSYTYDAAGHRTSMTDGIGTTHYAYDADGRLLTVTEPDGAVLAMAYDAAGQRSALTYPDGLQVGYGYDLNGRLTSLHDPRAGDAVYVLDADGRLLTEQLPGRLARRYHYEAGLLYRFLTLRDDRPAATTTLRHDPDGRILTLRTTGDGEQTHEYRYDPAGQLVYAVAGTGQRRQESHLAYDAAGNRVSLRRDGAETHYRYDEADQLIALETPGRHTEFRYDALGRLTEETAGDRHQAISYDGFGLPTVITSTGQAKPGGTDTERTHATFNGDGLLVSLVRTARNERDEEERAASARYRWSMGDQVPQILTEQAEPELDDAERREHVTADTDFTYGYGRTFASRDHSTAVFDHDALGSAVRTDQTGPWVQAPAYDAFGVPLALHASVPRNGGPRRGERGPTAEHRLRPPELPKFGYRGELALTGTPLGVYLRARTYDAALGRFTTRDPLHMPGGLTQPAAPYAYAGNDPLNLTDPLGTYIAPLPGTAGPAGPANHASLTPAQAQWGVNQIIRALQDSRGNRSGLHETFTQVNLLPPGDPGAEVAGAEIAHCSLYLNDSQTTQLANRLQAPLGSLNLATLLAGSSLAAAILAFVKSSGSGAAAGGAVAGEAAGGEAAAEGISLATVASVAGLILAVVGAVLVLMAREGQDLDAINSAHEGVVFHFPLVRFWTYSIHFSWPPTLVRVWSPWANPEQLGSVTGLAFAALEFSDVTPQ